MKKFVWVSCFLSSLLISSLAINAQVTVPLGSKLLWDQPASTLAVANALNYRPYLDAATNPGSNLTGVVCTGTSSPFSCSANFPAATPGNHTIAIDAFDGSSASSKSNSVSVTVVLFGTPINVRIGL